MNPPMMESPPEPQQREKAPRTEVVEATWKPLFWLGGVAAMLAVAIIIAAVLVFLIWPPPSDIAGWFALFQQNQLIGLLNLDLLMVVSSVALIPVYLALYVALRRISQALASLGLAFSLIGSALIVAANPAFGMLAVSDKYAVATSDAQRAMFMAAGQSLLANWVGTGFNVGYVLGGIAVLTFSVVMLASTVFNKVTAYTGVAMGVLMLVPASAGPLGVWISLVSLAPTALWLVLIGLKFFQMGGSLRAGGAGYVVARPRGKRRFAGT